MTIDARPDPRVLVLDERDNVAIAIASLSAATTIHWAGTTVELLDDIPVGHKIALAAIETDESVVKYGEVIGVATTPIAQGAHVHIHNLVSARLP